MSQLISGDQKVHL